MGEICGCLQGIDHCWVWQGARNSTGYGWAWDGMKTVLAHRLALKFEIGIYGKLFACHKCDNHLCVRPSHLFAGDQKANMADSVRKRKIRNGRENFSPEIIAKMHPPFKLNSQEVDSVIDMFKKGMTQHSIANYVNASDALICKIIKKYCREHPEYQTLTQKEKLSRAGRLYWSEHPEQRRIFSLKTKEYHQKNDWRKLTVDDVREIRKLYAEGIRAAVIALQKEVSISCVGRIVSRASWKKVE